MSMEMNKAMELLRGLVSEIERQTCEHEETHRGGAIWEICDSCGAKWADDEGGKPEFEWPESVEKAREFLAAHPTVEQAGGDERALQAEGAQGERRITISEESCGTKVILSSGTFTVEEVNSAVQEQRAALAQPSPAEDMSAAQELAGVKAILNDMADALKRLTFHARTTGGTAGPDAALMNACEHAERVLSLGGMGAAFMRGCDDHEAKAEQAEADLDFSRPLETENGEPVKWICADVIEYKSARVCVAKDTGLVYSSPYIGLKIRNVMPEQAEAERPEVVAYFDRNYPSTGDAFIWSNYEGSPYEPVMTVAQHDRIAGALRAENAQLSEDLNRLSIIRARLNLRLDFALDKISKLESRWPHGESPEERFEHYISNTIDRAPEPLRRLGNWLSHVLDEDQWTTAERMLTGACVAAEERAAAQTQHSVPEGWKPVPIEPLLNMMSDKDHDTRIMAERQLLSILADAPGKEVPQAWLDVQAERRRQVEAEGWTPKHDDEHADGQMAQAAGCYALHAGGIGTDWPDGRQNGAALFWPWDKDSWKPTTPRRDLVKACALALAEIERLDRAAATQGGPSDA